MAKTSKSGANAAKGNASRAYRSVGKTFDGVEVLRPKAKPTNFTRSEIRSIVREVLRENPSALRTPEKKGNIYVEPRTEGDYAVRRQNSQGASDVLPTQKDAIAKAKELEPHKPPIVKRVRNTESGNRGKWRKA